ncbi:MAG: hypothetical protein MjAS7_0039 [Metallosphaera javensis (ex Sakai et al. 2022)]|nr:MAG: hypothetical protein MjAS7_0039 [Metallosphaera javensis (ex Sakai et al. 2022)]
MEPILDAPCGRRVTEALISASLTSGCSIPRWPSHGYYRTMGFSRPQYIYACYHLKTFFGLSIPTLTDEVFRPLNPQRDQRLDLFLKGPHVKLNLSLENTRKRVELYKKGIMIADYIVSAEFASYRGKLPQDLEDMLDDLRRSYVVQKMVSLP